MVTIFGKAHCPYTSAAMEDFRKRGIAFEYVDVKKSRDDMQRMLEYSGGHRRVPVIVEDEKVTIGFGGT